VESVEASLKRLRTDYVDVLLLHRPDALVEPEEVASAFSQLHKAGMVRFFGVSNHTAMQIELLQKYVEQPLVINQVELSLQHAGMIDSGIMANQDKGRYTAADDTLDYCRVHDIMIQAWSPLAGGKLLSPSAKSSAAAKKTAKLISTMARQKQTSPEAIALAWLMRHPAPVLPIIGTLNPEHLKAACLADNIQLSREEWYTLFTAARGAEVP
jgi:predicted oxidoreductase